MSETEQKLTSSILNAFAERIGLEPDDDRFREVAERLRASEEYFLQTEFDSRPHNKTPVFFVGII